MVVDKVEFVAIDRDLWRYVVLFIPWLIVAQEVLVVLLQAWIGVELFELSAPLADPLSGQRDCQAVSRWTEDDLTLAGLLP